MKVEPGTVPQQIQAARGAPGNLRIIKVSRDPGDMPVQPLHLNDDHVTPGGACGFGVSVPARRRREMEQENGRKRVKVETGARGWEPLWNVCR